MKHKAAVEPPSLLPMISASIYCHGSVDELLQQVIRPFWRDIKVMLPQACLWVIRYARGGQHLKIRLHAPAEVHGTAANHLREVVEAFFAELPLSAKDERDAAEYLPPIDPEDHAGGLRPDRSLIWTRYRYSPELVGAEPLSSATGFETVFVHCRAAATEVTLDWLEALDSGEISMRKRMALALQLFLAAIYGIHSHADTRVRYLTFQRDWLLRINLDREQALMLLERKVEELVAQQKALGPLVTATSLPEGVLGAWCEAVGSLVRFCLDQFGRQDISDLDSDSEALIYFAISRIVHNAMNLVAIGISNEAYICQLLKSALVRSRADERRAV
jgi:lantibiotic biosynthesis dehydratase-like protein